MLKPLHGNFLYGGAIKNLVYSEFKVKKGGHANQIVRGEKGSGFLDSRGDQSAISEGHNSIDVLPKKENK